MADSRPFPHKAAQTLQNKIYDGGVADNQHMLILPANTTTNLANLGRQQAALAYDQTQNAVVVDNGSGFSSVVPSSGVTAGSYTSANITVNDQGQVTAAANGTSGSSNILPVRITTGAVTVNSSSDFAILLNDSSGSALHINLPAGVNGLSFSFSQTGASINAVTTYTLIGHGSDTIDSQVANSPLSSPSQIIYYSGTWYALS